ncbi:GNAT family N-acetyltransferase [Aquimarina intermedia]|uniref:Ribosomal protein S18 acetylase RimI-like enzyme n=1 Tax=Aquimarina intermedia TaxID=350814 RepID=A0A5S5CDD1_9FLAO|nr:GNAT family N-acetyltransferase [Aquimarina intermedia]TYP77385.1 ribosomal protein S18 acetylase RimI-like enzyme [Aquimarina intermedia]
MNIRKATPDDIIPLSVLFDAYRVFYKKKSDPEAAQNFLKERITQNDSEILVCETAEGILVGFTQLYPLFSSRRMQKLWLLNDLFVDQEYRGQGLSIQLIDRAKQLVGDTNACGMYLETEKSNFIGNALYPRAGFTHNANSNFYEWNASNY